MTPGRTPRSAQSHGPASSLQPRRARTRPGAPPGIRGGAADARPRLRAGAAARARVALRRARPRARRRAGRGHGCARPRRGGRLVPRRRVRGPVSVTRCALGIGPLADAAPDRRARPRTRRARAWWARVRLCGGAGRGHAARAMLAPPRSASPRATSRASTPSPRSWRTQATRASSGSRSAATSPSAAGSSMSIRRPAASRFGSSCSATRSSRSARSPRSRSARCARSSQRRSIPPPSGAVSSWRSSFPTATSRSACRPTSSRRSRSHPISSGRPTKCGPSGRRRH